MRMNSIHLLHDLLMLLLVDAVLGGLEGKGLGPQEGLLAARAVHVIAATVLLNLDVAERAELEKFRILGGPSLEKLVILFLAGTALLIEKAKAELLLAAVRIDAEAVLLGEVATLQRARMELAIVLKLSEGLIEGEAVKLVPSGLIDELLDLHFIDDLAASKVRALDTDHLNEVDDDGDAITGDNGDLVMKTRGTTDLNTKVTSDTVEAEAMTTVQSCNQGVEIAEADTAFILRARSGEIEGETRGSRGLFQRVRGILTVASRLKHEVEKLRIFKVDVVAAVVGKVLLPLRIASDLVDEFGGRKTLQHGREENFADSE